MTFPFDERRAAEAAAVLLRRSKGRLNYTWMLKVLYLADREALAKTGSPIVGGSFCNMKAGPLGSDVYNCIKGEGRAATWQTFIRKDGYFVELINDPGDDDLSEYDIEVLTRLFDQHKHLTYSQMIDRVHELSEWVDPGTSSDVLSPEQILRAQGVPEEEIRKLQDLNSHIAGVNELLS